MKFIKAGILIFSILFVSCAVNQKPVIENIPEIDVNTPIFFWARSSMYKINLVNLISSNYLAKTYSMQEDTTDSINNDKTKNNLFKNPLLKLDNSHDLRASLSNSGKYLIRADAGTQMIHIRFGRYVDVNLIDLEKNQECNKYKIFIPYLEYEREKYQIPWSKIDEAFYAISGDTLFKYYIDGKRDVLLINKKMRDFSVSPDEKYAAIFADDSLFLCQLENKTKTFLVRPKKILSGGAVYFRGFSWYNSSDKIAFGVNWNIYVYNTCQKQIDKYKAKGKVFHTDWITGTELLVVTGDYPRDLHPNQNTLQTKKEFKIFRYDLENSKSTFVHDQIDHEPFTIKPYVSPSKKYFLFSECKYNRPYEVKLMSLNGKYEKVLSEGILPFWGNQRINKISSGN